MKKNIIIAALALVAIPALAQRYDPETPFQQKSLATDEIREVKAETSGGNISIKGISGSEARIEVYIWPGNNKDKNLSKEEIQQRLTESYDLSVSVSDHVLTAVAKPKKQISNWKRSLSISFRIFVPESASSHLRTSGGNIALNDLSGDVQDFATSGGNMDINNLSGKITGKTSGGNIHVSGSSKNIRLTTSGGNIAAEKSTGDIYLSTSGGNLSLEGLNGNIEASTSGGNVQASEIEGELHASTSGGNVGLSELSASVEASTSGGSINVSMRKMGKYLTLHNSGGNIALRMPGGVGMNLQLRGDRVKVNQMNNFSGNSDEHHIDGTINGGGIPVKVDGGRIDITIQ